MFSSIEEIEAPELASWVENGTHPLRVIDVREMAEIARGIMPGAEPVPLTTHEKLVLVCHSGARSAQACHFLKQQGFDNVYNLRGGMLGWAHNALPIVRPEL